METRLSKLLFADLSQELKITRRMLSAVPESQYDWKPHNKSFSVGELATHLANLLAWQEQIFEHDYFDLASGQARQSARRQAHTEKKALLDEFDEKSNSLKQRIEEADDETLTKNWKLKQGQTDIYSIPKAVALRNLVISHLVHHRGQLTVYLRQLGLPVPKTYGPTADER